MFMVRFLGFLSSIFRFLFENSFIVKLSPPLVNVKVPLEDNVYTPPSPSYSFSLPSFRVPPVKTPPPKFTTPLPSESVMMSPCPAWYVS